MSITTKGKNAMKLMLDLGNHAGGEPVKLRDIARRQDISEKYLEQIVSVLNKAGLVFSIRGAGGGYRLTKRPDEYTVGEIIKCVEGNMAVADCVGNYGNPCFNKANCVCFLLWEKLDDAMNGVLEEITLADLLDWQTELLSDQYTI
ncbi:MAG: Rrf2 family transcriptional regulator [Lachnospiraceae bacterium]|nr:Rrf2 family transcriptional regulator [Lachnospiraceae bacterium]